MPGSPLAVEGASCPSHPPARTAALLTLSSALDVDPLSTPIISLESPSSPSGMSHLGPDSVRDTSRSRSLSPTPSSPPRAVVSPRTSRVFASRPSPVVPSPSLPASPSISRPPSPRPPRGDDGPHSPAPPHELPVSAAALAVDLNHIFERGTFP